MQVNKGTKSASCPLSALFAGYFIRTITSHKQRSQPHLQERAGVRSQMTSLQEEWASGAEQRRKKRGQERRLV